MLWKYRIVKRDSKKDPYGYQFKSNHWLGRFLDCWSTASFSCDSHEEMKSYINQLITWDMERDQQKKSKHKIIEVIEP